MKNPFTLTFGVMPEKFIRREEIISTVMTGFLDGENDSHTYILTGVRGSGKTVMLNYLKKQFAELDDWIVINVNPEIDILESVAAKLYEKGSMKKYFVKASFNFSFHGLGFSIEGDTPIKTIETLLEKMMGVMKERNQKVLIAIDEITSNTNIKVFSHTYKNMVNDGYPVYLLATGLNENVNNLQNEETLTFIYRASKIYVKPLNLSSIAQSYRETLGLNEEFSIKCAALTEGYASAYQILGSILYRTGKKELDDEILSEFDNLLEEINYDKLWDDLTRVEKDFLNGFLSQKGNKAVSIIEHSTISRASYSKYRERLIKRGIVRADSYGYLSLTLPRLYDYIQRKKIYDMI